MQLAIKPCMKTRNECKMGKQINYWMDYESFLLVAQKAINSGCTIIKEDLASGKVFESKDIAIVTPYGKFCRTAYYFHLLEAGPIKILTVNGKECLDSSFTATGNAVIEAGYSFTVNEPTGVAGTQRKKEIRRSRLYCTAGYYDENKIYIQRPDCLTKVYNSLAKYVKKIAPYTEFTDVLTSTKAENYGEKYEYKHKEYITQTCLDMVNNEGYKRC